MTVSTNVVSLHAQAPERARDYTAQQLQLIRQTVASDCNALEFDLFIEMARRIGLDAFRRQVYAIVTGKDDEAKRKLVVVTGIDGFRAVAARCGDYRPDDEETRIVYDEALKNPDTNPLGIEKAVARAFKRDNAGVWHAVIGIAHWDEFAPITDGARWEDTGEVWADTGKKKRRRVEGKPELDPKKKNWRTMPRTMISKCAESQALRKGWPEDLSGVYANEEMDRTVTIEGTATEIVEQHQQEQRLALVNARHSVPILWTTMDGVVFVPVGEVADKVAAFVEKLEDPEIIVAWRDMNRAGLQQFWAMARTDALGVKKLIEARISKLRAAAMTPLAGA